jgi:hypothetical protein
LGRRISTHRTVVDLRKIPLGIPRRRWDGNDKLALKKYNVKTKTVFPVLAHNPAALCSQH